MRKTYVLDTSVLVHDPHSLKNFPRSNVILPIYVLDELDKLKTQINQAGKNARVCIKQIDKLCEEGDIHLGIETENDVIIKVDTSIVDPKSFGDQHYVDNKILACAAKLQKENTDALVTLVSRDINLRIRARAFGINAEHYDNENVKSQDLFTGSRDVFNEELGEKLLLDGFLDTVYDETKDILPNEFVLFHDNEGEDVISIGRKSRNKIVKIKSHRPWGLEAKSREQAMALDLLMDNAVPLVSLAGLAGSGKTLLSIAAGMELVLEQKRYKKLIVLRPINSLGNDIGFLPGSVSEKTLPYFGPIFDSVEFLLEKKKSMFDMWIEKGIISLEPITYLRGRSIHDALIIFDEVQNVSPFEIKSVLSRAGKGTKMVLLGDYSQIDNRTLDATNNALSYVIEKFKKSNLAGSLILTHCERSALAEEAASLL